MTWKAFHNRGETLRSVMATAEVRRDGILPTDVAGVTETFRDELDLLGALHLKWHTRLAGHVERELATQPMDLRHAVATAWARTADQMPGVRAILDHYREHPVDDRMAWALARATAKELHFLAVMAGRAGLGDEASQRIGLEIEERARRLRLGVPTIERTGEEGEESGPRRSLIDRLRAVVAA